MRFVASLTTTPTRLPKIREALISILDQEDPWEIVYLSIPVDRNPVLPSWLIFLETKDFHKTRLVILRPDKDIGPLSKLVPALQRELSHYKEATWLTILDDDQHIHPGVSKKIKYFVKSFPHAEGYAFSFSGFKAGTLFSGPIPVYENASPQEADWIQGTHSITMAVQSFKNIAHFLPNHANSLRHHLQELAIEKRQKLLKLFAVHDDHYISVVLQGVLGKKCISMPYSPADYFKSCEYATQEGISISNDFILQVLFISRALHECGVYSQPVSVASSMWFPFVLPLILLLVSYTIVIGMGGHAGVANILLFLVLVAWEWRIVCHYAHMLF